MENDASGTSEPTPVGARRIARRLSVPTRPRPPLLSDAAKQVLHNVDSLNSHTAFLFDKINFLMDATIGFIN